MRRILFYCVLVGAICLAMGAPLWALEDKSDGREGSAVTLDEAVVSAKRDAAATAETGFVPLGSDQHKVTPADRARTSSTADLLYDVPGVSLQQNGGVATIPFLHGLGDDRIRIKVDGMDLISACANHMNSPLSYIDSDQCGQDERVGRYYAGQHGRRQYCRHDPGQLGRRRSSPSPAKAFCSRDKQAPFIAATAMPSAPIFRQPVANEYFSMRYSGSEAQSENYHAARDFKPAGPAATDRGWLAGDEVGSSSYQILEPCNRSRAAK